MLYVKWLHFGWLGTTKSQTGPTRRSKYVDHYDKFGGLYRKTKVGLSLRRIIRTQDNLEAVGPA